MKRIYKTLLKIIAIVGATIFFSSCNSYLDVDKYFDDVQTLDSAFTKRIYAEGFLSNAFEVMMAEVSDIPTGDANEGGYLLWASDDLLRMGSETKKYQNAEYGTEVTLSDDKWKRVYEPVRKASTFIKYIDLCKEMTTEERVDAKAQAYFLRGYAYWTLLRQYGPLPLIPEEGFDIGMSYEQLSVQRNTFDECVDAIEKDFITAAQNLRTIRTANNIGRPTRGAALAARARLLIMAASPLYNGNSDLFELRNHDGVQLISQEKDMKKWAKAAAAAKEVIDLSNTQGLYELYTAPQKDETIAPPSHPEYSTASFPNGWSDIDVYASYKDLFDGTAYPSKHKEIIFHRPNKNNLGRLNNFSIPYSLQGENSMAVTQKQVDAYYMNDGSTLQEAKNSGYYLATGFSTSAVQENYLPAQVSLQYARKEPRFYASIAYNGSVWECESATQSKFKDVQVFYYKGEGDGKGFGNSDNYPITGIGLKKFYNPEDSRTIGGYVVPKFEPAIRYAEVLLWYAEALNELPDGELFTIPSYIGENVEVKRTLEEMRGAMKPIRMRVGLPDFSDQVYKDYQTFQNVLKKERQIEFFAEGKRYYDLRRWKDAEVEENMPIMGCNTEMSNTDQQKEAFHTPTLISTYPKIFIKEKMYLWPIPRYELKRNKKLTQNPGW